MNELLPYEMTSTVEEAGGTRIWRIHGTRQLDSVEAGGAQIDFGWEAHISFKHPGTWTDAEARDVFIELGASLARARSFMVVASLPDEVMSAILPQLEDMADYEIRMWQVRQEVEGPDIEERWISLPMAT